MEDVYGDPIEISDILVSLLLEANPKLTYAEVRHLVIKYEVPLWDRAKEVLRGPK